jgi:hypothetical protein
VMSPTEPTVPPAVESPEAPEPSASATEDTPL